MSSILGRCTESVLLSDGGGAPSIIPPVINSPEYVSEEIVQGHYIDETMLKPLGCYLVENIEVSGRGHVFIGGEFLDDAEFLPFYWKRLLQNNPHIIIDEQKLPTRLIQEPCVVFMGHGPRVYGHFIAEMLPRLELARQCFSDLGIDKPKYLVNSNSPSWLIKMLEELGINNLDIEYYSPSTEKVLLAQGILPSFPSTNGVYHPYSANLYSATLDRLDLVQQVARPNRKVFFSRKGFENNSSKTRFMLGADELMLIAVDEFGFEIVSPENLDWKSQIELVQSTGLLVGEAGSALHNSLFAGRGMVLGSLGFRNMLQSNICTLMNQRCSYLNSVGHGKSAFKIDVNSYRKWLKQLCMLSAL